MFQILPLDVFFDVTVAVGRVFGVVDRVVVFVDFVGVVLAESMGDAVGVSVAVAVGVESGLAGGSTATALAEGVGFAASVVVDVVEPDTAMYPRRPIKTTPTLTPTAMAAMGWRGGTAGAFVKPLPMGVRTD